MSGQRTRNVAPPQLCDWCGARLGWRQRRDARFCSEGCKQKAYRERRYFARIGLVERRPLLDEELEGTDLAALAGQVSIAEGDFSREVPCDGCAASEDFMILIGGVALPAGRRFLMFHSEDCLLDWVYARL